MGNELLSQLVVSGVIIALVALIHAIFVVMIRGFLWVPDERRGFTDEVIGVVKLLLVSLWMIAAQALSATVWASAFWHLGVTATFSEGLYFALSTYTTLGFGDVLAPESWRLLTGFSALNGLLMFGLSAAVLVDAAVRLRKPRR